MEKVELVFHLQDGMSAKIDGGKVVIEFETKDTKKEFGNAQLQVWNNKLKEWGYLTLNTKNRLSYRKAKF